MTGLYHPDVAVASARYWADIGFREGSNNRNPFSFWQYGNYYAPYCDSFVCYAAYMGGFRFHGSDYGDRGYAWVTAHHLAANAQGLSRRNTSPVRPGWLAIFNFGKPDQHIEMVISRDDPTKALPSTFATIGGNTGDAVLYRIRYRRDVQTFIDMDSAGQNAGPISVPEATVKRTERTRAVLTKDDTGRYYLGADGGVFCFGSARFHGSIVSLVIAKTSTALDLTKDWAIDLQLTPTENGYWILTRLGSIFAFGDAKYLGSFHKLCNDTNPMVELIPSGGASYMGMRWDGQRFTGQPG